MVEITATNRVKKKERKEMRTVSEISGTTLNTQYSHYKALRRRKEKESEKIFEEIVVENFPNMGKEKNHSSPRSTENPIQGKSKDEHAKTPVNQTGKNCRHK